MCFARALVRAVACILNIPIHRVWGAGHLAYIPNGLVIGLSNIQHVHSAQFHVARRQVVTLQVPQCFCKGGSKETGKEIHQKWRSVAFRWCLLLSRSCACGPMDHQTDSERVDFEISVSGCASMCLCKACLADINGRQKTCACS